MVSSSGQWNKPGELYGATFFRKMAFHVPSSQHHDAKSHGHTNHSQRITVVAWLSYFLESRIRECSAASSRSWPKQVSPARVDSTAACQQDRESLTKSSSPWIIVRYFHFRQCLNITRHTSEAKCDTDRGEIVVGKRASWHIQLHTAQWKERGNENVCLSDTDHCWHSERRDIVVGYHSIHTSQSDTVHQERTPFLWFSLRPQSEHIGWTYFVRASMGVLSPFSPTKRFLS